MHNTPHTKFLSDKVLASRYGVSRNTIWRWTREGRLPKPHKLAAGTTRWLVDEIEVAEGGSAQIEALIAADPSLVLKKK